MSLEAIRLIAGWCCWVAGVCAIFGWFNADHTAAVAWIVAGVLYFELARHDARSAALHETKEIK